MCKSCCRFADEIGDTRYVWGIDVNVGGTGAGLDIMGLRRPLWNGRKVTIAIN
jgi:hypothetical protein